jgi:hypothetical protein
MKKYSEGSQSQQKIQATERKTNKTSLIKTKSLSRNKLMMTKTNAFAQKFVLLR